MRQPNLIAKRRVPVLGRTMSCVDEGSGDPIVFLHGNPTSSYLWRNVWPHLAGRGRIIVPDLIGMGDSDKLPVGEPDRYRFVCHSRYLDALLTALGVRDRVVLVLHDWGGALGFDWANRNRSAVRGLAYTETFVRPLGWSDLPESFRPTLRAVRSPDGERMVLGENMFIEKMLPGDGSARPKWPSTDGRFWSRVIAGFPRSSGHAKCRWTASRLMSRRGSRPTRSGWPPARYRSCLSTPTLGCSYRAAHESSAGRGPTKLR